MEARNGQGLNNWRPMQSAQGFGGFFALCDGKFKCMEFWRVTEKYHTLVCGVARLFCGMEASVRSPKWSKSAVNVDMQKM